MSTEYCCPCCYSDVTVGETEAFVRCPACKTLLEVNRDADFKDGLWRDLTTLRPHEDFWSDANGRKLT